MSSVATPLGSIKSAQVTALFAQRHLIMLYVLFAVAFGLRLVHSDAPPLDFHTTRQYRSLIIARGYYAEAQTSLSEQQRRIAIANRQSQGILEPPIMELLVSSAYRVMGGEHFWIPRLLASAFWLIGGGFLYRIANRTAGVDAALFSTAFYLFLPFAVIASRSFQPDPLMVMLMLISVDASLRYHEQPATSWLVAAASAAALASLVKPVSLFVLLSVFVALALSRQGRRRTVTGSGLPFFAAATLLPTLTFYFYGTFIAGFLRDQAQASFLPQLLFNSFFWRGWLSQIGLVVGFTAFIGALLGTLMFRPGLPKALLIGWWGGYALFCLIFDYHTATHDYYHLQLIPLVALALGPVFVAIVNRLEQTSVHPASRLAVWGILALALLLNIGLALPRPLDPRFERQVQVAQEIGGRVDHSTRTVFLDSDYGLPLEYHGELSGVPWPIASDLEWERLAGVQPLTAEERFNRLYAKDSPEYFIILDLRDFEAQAELRDFLTRNFPLVAQTDDYSIFDLRQKVSDSPNAPLPFTPHSLKRPARDDRWR